mmetsp:Transcript_44155/g.103269  ORF Transcript_44155/g.103269 Transcript_44155/m.103269 type:complete len:341 (-) Transcript_44155:81-1103(-)
MNTDERPKVLEGIALVGNPQFAIIDEAYPYLSRRLLTDDSPRMREALRYMVYGNSQSFDVDRLIDLLQALEKFVAVRDTGDGTAYKVDGVRGGVYVGQAGDARGTQTLKDADGASARSALDAYRAEVQQSGATGLMELDRAFSIAPARPQPPAQAASAAARKSEAEESAAKVRAALRFFFSDDGAIFRAFLLDEVANAADALSREALAALAATPAARAIDALPAPRALKATNRRLFAALAPPLSENDQKTLDSIRKLVGFFAGDLELADDTAAAMTSNEPSVLRSLAPDPAALERARALLPVLQENQVEMRRFSTAIIGRLAELQTSRAIGLLRSRVGAM